MCACAAFRAKQLEEIITAFIFLLILRRKIGILNL